MDVNIIWASDAALLNGTGRCNSQFGSVFSRNATFIVAVSIVSPWVLAAEDVVVVRLAFIAPTLDRLLYENYVNLTGLKPVVNVNVTDLSLLFTAPFVPFAYFNDTSQSQVNISASSTSPNLIAAAMQYKMSHFLYWTATNPRNDGSPLCGGSGGSNTNNSNYQCIGSCPGGNWTMGDNGTMPNNGNSTAIPSYEPLIASLISSPSPSASGLLSISPSASSSMDPIPLGRRLGSSTSPVMGARIVAHDSTLLFLNLWLIDARTLLPLQRGIPSTASGTSLFFPSGRGDARVGGSGTAPVYAAGTAHEFLALGINGVNVHLTEVNWILAGSPAGGLGLSATSHVLKFTSPGVALLLPAGTLRPGFFYTVSAAPSLTATLSATAASFNLVDAGTWSGVASSRLLRNALLFVHMPPRTLFAASPLMGSSLVTSFRLAATAVASNEGALVTVSTDLSVTSFLSAAVPGAPAFVATPLAACTAAATATVTPAWYAFIVVLARLAGLAPASACASLSRGVIAAGAPLPPIPTKNLTVSFRRFTTLEAGINGTSAVAALIAKYDVTSAAPDAAALGMTFLADPGGSLGDLLGPIGTLPASTSTVLAGASDGSNASVIIVAIAVDSDGSAGLDAVMLTVEPLKLASAGAATAFVEAASAALTVDSIAQNPQGALNLIAALGGILAGAANTTVSADGSVAPSVVVNATLTAANTAIRSDLIGSVGTAMLNLADSKSEGRGAASDSEIPGVMFTKSTSGVLIVNLAQNNYTEEAKEALKSDSTIHLGDSTLSKAASALALLTANVVELSPAAAKSALDTTLALLTLSLPTNVLAEVAVGGRGDAATAAAAPVARAFPPSAAAAIMNTLSNVLSTLAVTTAVEEAVPEPVVPDGVSASPSPTPSIIPLYVDPQVAAAAAAAAAALRAKVLANLAGLGAAVLRGARAGDPPISLSSGPSSAFAGGSGRRLTNGASPSYCGAALSFSSVRLNSAGGGNGSQSVALGSPITACRVAGTNASTTAATPPLVSIPSALINRLGAAVGTAVDLILTQTGTTDLSETAGSGQMVFAVPSSGASSAVAAGQLVTAADALAAKYPPPAVAVDLAVGATLATRVFAISLQSPSGSQLVVKNVGENEKVNFSLPLRSGGSINDAATALSAKSPTRTYFIDCPAPELGVSASVVSFARPWLWALGTLNASMSVEGGALSSVNVTLVAIEPVTFVTSITALRSGTAAALTTTGLPVGGLSGIFASGLKTLSSIGSSNAPFELVAPAFIIRVNCGAPVGARNATCGPGFYGKVFNFSCPIMKSQAYCAWWDVNTSSFSTIGCTALPSAEAGGAITCSCDHLTEFAARFAAVALQQKSIFAAAKSLGDPRTLARYPHIFILLGCIFAALIGLGVAGMRADARGAILFAQSLASDPDVRTMVTLDAAHGRTFVLDARLPKELCDAWLLAPVAEGSVVEAVDKGASDITIFGNESGKAINLYTASVYMRLVADLEPLHAKFNSIGSRREFSKAGVSQLTLEALSVNAPPLPPSDALKEVVPSDEGALTLRTLSELHSGLSAETGTGADEPSSPSDGSTFTSTLRLHRSSVVSDVVIEIVKDAVATAERDVSEAVATTAVAAKEAAAAAAAKVKSIVSIAVGRARQMLNDIDNNNLGDLSSFARALRLRGLIARVFVLRLFYEHPLFSIIWRYDARQPRMLRFAAFASAISLNLFAEVFLYAYSAGSPGQDLPPLEPAESIVVGVLSAILPIPALKVLSYVYEAAAEEHFRNTYPGLAEELRCRHLAEELLDLETLKQLEVECGDYLIKSAVDAETVKDVPGDLARESKAAGWSVPPAIVTQMLPGCLRMIGRHPDQRDAFIAARKEAIVAERSRALARSKVAQSQDDLTRAIERPETGGGFKMKTAIKFMGRAGVCRVGGSRMCCDASSWELPRAAGPGSFECGGIAARTAWLLSAFVTGGCLFYVVLFGMTQPTGATSTFLSTFFISQFWGQLVQAPITLCIMLVFNFAILPVWAPWLALYKGGTKAPLTSRTALTGRLENLALVRATGSASSLSPDEALAAFSKQQAVVDACGDKKTHADESHAARSAVIAAARDALVYRRFFVAQARGAEFSIAQRAAAAEALVVGAAGAAAPPHSPAEGDVNDNIYDYVATSPNTICVVDIYDQDLGTNSGSDKIDDMLPIATANDIDVEGYVTPAVTPPASAENSDGEENAASPENWDTLPVPSVFPIPEEAASQRVKWYYSKFHGMD